METLEENIMAQLGCETEEEYLQTLKDICTGGANAGFSGFVYSSEMLDFYKQNREMILENQKELANDLGTNLIEMIHSFNCLKDSGLTFDEIAEIIYGKNYEHECASLVIDAMCWAVLECFAFRHDN